ncbi:MAG: DNA-binding protein [Pseudonocardiaceae bacterium]|nr:DNA-binding protein [Pseudonocardiaceae bacterium]
MSGVKTGTGGSSTATSGSPRPGRGPHSTVAERSITRAWEGFAAGEDIVEGVRPEILASWYRCRDQHNVDPHLTVAPGATDLGEHPMDHDVIFAELGGLAVLAADHIHLQEGIVTVTDGAGRILASWGDQPARHRAADSNLAPWAGWAEQASGTNGMGTALQVSGPVSVTGAEHWCEGFHEWACAGVAIRDLVTDTPIAAINVSRWQEPLPAHTTEWLAKSAATVEAGLRTHAVEEGRAVVAAFTEASSKTRGPLAGLDAGGRIVIANSAAGALLGVPHDRPLVDPADRWASEFPKLTALARRAAREARHDSQWVGPAQLLTSQGDAAVTVSMHPVFMANHLAGMLCDFGSHDGEPHDNPPGNASSSAPRRIVGTRNERLVLLAPSEIRFVDADRNTVWLITDRGRIRATTHGLDNVENVLSGQGFLRVHRRFLVNLRRIQEVERGFKGELLLITDPRGPEIVPVSRRHVPELRQALGM